MSSASSSSAAGNSRSGSVADSLEDQQAALNRLDSATKNHNGNSCEPKAVADEETVQTIKNYISGGSALKTAAAAAVNEQQKLKTTSNERLNSSTAAPLADDGNKSSNKVENNNNVKQPNKNSNETSEPTADNKRQQSVQKTTNNYTGLNLNMTASEMRELIASRKKFDPKKAQMNIRQKYEIIQQM